MRSIGFQAALLAALVTCLSAPAQQAPTTLSSNEMHSIRPIVLRDLRYAVSIANNDPHPPAKDLRAAWRQCTFSKLQLGALGTAVVVAWPGLTASANNAMVDIYLPAGKSWRRVADGEGFGPRILSANQPTPDLVFGWTSGVCHATFVRYAYRNGSYHQDACDQEVEPAETSGDCRIVACQGSKKWPTFADPWPPADGPNP